MSGAERRTSRPVRFRPFRGAFKSQLGLELKPIDILVIDHVERPSEN
jgi:hypothetical protein